MKYFDISWPITIDVTCYKDRKSVQLKQTKQFDVDGVRETHITIGSHSGTHIDAPAHFMQNGNTINELGPLACVGSAVVLDMTHVDGCIDVADLHSCEVTPGNILLFKTKNSQRSATAPFDYEFVYVTAAAAQWCVQQKIKAVGIDYLGIERDQPDHATHTTFMQHNVPIIEGLRLAAVSAGTYFLWCLPLSMPGLDAAPARALLVADG